MEKRNVVAIVLFVFSSCSTVKEATSPVAAIPWQDQPVVIDGNDDAGNNPIPKEIHLNIK